MDETIPFGSFEYYVLLALLLFARGMDFLSTWVATPRLILEGNPIAKWLGWKWGALVNIVVCALCAATPLPAIIISTTSLLVAARNFQGAWLMRVMGEYEYRLWMSERLAGGRKGLFILCLIVQCVLMAFIGAGLIWYGGGLLIPVGAGYGMLIYGFAVLFYSSLSLYRSRSGGGS